MVSSEITPERVFLQRRSLLARGSSVAIASASTALFASPDRAQANQKSRGLADPQPLSARPGGPPLVDKPTAWEDVTGYNNFYEFGTDKADPQRVAPSRLRVSPWTLRVDGLVAKPLTLDLDDLRGLAPLEERVYRMRCVEGWSMVIPWVGYPLTALMRRVDPLGSAKFVEFTSLADASMMPGLSSRVLEWPYREGLRMDEAAHPLTLLSLGLYGKTLTAQNGAPVRLVVPWKYGFKSAKSLVRIRFVDRQPATSWNLAAPQEYGFFSNVNPAVPHRRWSQATERRIGEDGLFSPRRPTLPFNGYAEEVASLYRGMDLKTSF